MSSSWKCEAGHLTCRWPEVGERATYNPPWMQQTASNVTPKLALPLFLDFARLSPFGGQMWIAIRCYRRSCDEIAAECKP
jgi:hypothetical protein